MSLVQVIGTHEYFIRNQSVQRKIELLDFFNKKQGKAGLVGVSANAEKITIAHVVLEKGKPALGFCEEFDAPTDKEREEILEREGTQTNFVLPHSDYKLFLVEAPKVESHEMEAAVKWKIKDLVDSNVDELAVTLFPVPDDAYRGQSDMVYVVASRKSKIKQVVDLIVNSGLNLQSIDIPELVLMNISSRFCDDTHGLAFIDLRSSGSTLNLSKEGSIYLTRHLNTRVDQNIFNSEEWASVKERLVLEIERSLDYYESQMGQSPISKIQITPGENESDMLVAQLNELMAVQVTGLKLADEFESEEKYPEALLQSCILAIGGAMRNLRVAT